MRIFQFILVLGASLFLFLSTNSAQSKKRKANYVNIVIPKKDTTIAGTKYYRLAANTLPGSRVTLNGKKLKVYRSGAVVNLMKLDIGKNVFVLRSYGPHGKKITKSFVIIRKDVKLRTTPKDSLVIEDVQMLPDKDVWLDQNDILEVRIKGTPNGYASFMNGIPMQELPVDQTNGIGGIYVGTYKVKETDFLVDEPIKFRLENGNGEVVEKESKAKVSFLPKMFPRIAVTRDERPYLNYGLGTNRLGGAKLSFIEPGIKLMINGRVGDQYRVKLTDDFEAWIPMEQVTLLPLGTPLPKTLTGSWNVYGDKKYDYVVVNLSEKIPYSTTQEVDPTRIIVNLYGATSNTNWITQHLSSKNIKNVTYRQVSKDLFRIIIEPVYKQIWGYGISYNGNSLVIKIKRQPKRLNIKNLTFVIDAGHGGSNYGALGATGLKEKDFTLKTAKYLKKALRRKGARVVMTRTDDSFSLNSKRLETVLESGADILISIHANSIGTSTNPLKARGTSTYYKHICFRPLSQKIYKRMLELGLQPFGNIGNFNFTLNSPTEIPNVLVETAFISNPLDEMKLISNSFKRRIADKIVKGVEDFLRDVKKNKLN